jgi:hypothetical protein
MKPIKQDSGACAILDKLHDIAWHAWHLNRITDELNKIGISDEDIDAFLGDFDKAMKAYAGTIERA